jgi:hypothetical protein
MWEIPWWSALIMAWGAGSLGFILGAILARGKQAEEAAALRVKGVRRTRQLQGRSLRLR